MSINSSLKEKHKENRARFDLLSKNVIGKKILNIEPMTVQKSGEITGLVIELESGGEIDIIVINTLKRGSFFALFGNAGEK